MRPTFNMEFVDFIIWFQLGLEGKKKVKSAR